MQVNECVIWRYKKIMPVKETVLWKEEEGLEVQMHVAKFMITGETMLEQSVGMVLRKPLVALIIFN